MPSPSEHVWQDREVRFDSLPSQMQCRKGEVIIDSISSVEDTKGNNGERDSKLTRQFMIEKWQCKVMSGCIYTANHATDIFGKCILLHVLHTEHRQGAVVIARHGGGGGSLVVTNLRIQWISHRFSRVNLSIGFSTVSNIVVRKAKSRLRGSTEALCVSAKYQQCRFDFVFTSLVNDSPRIFTTVKEVLNGYGNSTLYRELKLRGSIIKDKRLITLPQEDMYSKVEGVWNLSSDQGNLGCFFLTNVRLVWHANLAQNFNVSIPYMQMRNIRVRDSKFGPALVVETSSSSGGYILGFRIDPAEKLKQVHKELLSLYKVHGADPIFGVDYQEHGQVLATESRAVSMTEDDIDVLDTEEPDSDAVAAYYAEFDKGSDREVIFDAELGLAVESLRGEISSESLWRIV